MNKLLTAIALLVLSMPLSAKTPNYTVVQGEAWNVSSGSGEVIRSSDRVCKNTTCYSLGSKKFSAYQRVERDYDLRQVDFLHLSQLASVKPAGNRLKLPTALGAKIFKIARQENIRDLLQLNN